MFGCAKPTLYSSTAETFAVLANRKKKISAFEPLHETLFADVAPGNGQSAPPQQRLIARQPQAPNRMFRCPDETMNGAAMNGAE